MGVAIGRAGELPLGALNIAIPTVRYDAQVREAVVALLARAADRLYRSACDAAQA